ncbi:heme NO-binding domain-containing protein [Thiomicrorhabdus xiamenensis]|uniref:Heme NO-binding domain-containing protein n=1 Tax=Thiomicrorhabdus xiamenensis TaxID=2739063 RepID=A0A7D4NR75_9GAMM|nr:heme NO-binding domain-containing protein [Thiomicrorhabdus xiamenensis]QKI89652.1 heme NO-binding domain-containing protein [Thiomicrorhabdus xiamenensis]
MKGIVFSEFIELVEEKFGLEILDAIIEEADLPSQGAYTQVGTYDHKELLVLLDKLSAHSGIDATSLSKIFGEHLLKRFAELYPQFFVDIDNCFDLLKTIDTRVHLEVQQLYPEAELPSFDNMMVNADTMQLIYQSSRPFSALAYGLINGSASYFGETIDIQMNDQSDAGKSFVVFTLKKRA